MGLVHHPNVVTDGLVGCWDAANRKSYPGTGDDWGDLVNSATAEGQNFDQTPEHVNDWAGTFLLDGTDEYFEIPHADLEVLGAFTFSIWLRFTTATTDGIGGYVSFSLRGGGSDLSPAGSGWNSEFTLSILNNLSGWVTHSVRIGCKAGGHSQMAMWDSKIYSPYSNYDVWRNYCAVYKGGTPNDPDNFIFYFDGVDQGTRDGQYGWGVTNNNTFWSKDGGDAGYFGGYLGTIHLHNRALTAAEIKQNYEALKPRFEPRITKSGMLANWDAGDPQSYNGGTTWKDTANHYDGTLENDGDGSLTFDSANGGSLVFDGTDDYVGPIAIGDYSGTARSVIIWGAADDYSDEGLLFNSASAKFSASLGMYGGYFIFKSKMTHTGTYQQGIAASSLVDGSWHCWAVTINASDEIVAIYQDGESKTDVHSNGWFFRDDTYIGARMNGSTLETAWEGKIGTVRLYTKTLSDAQIMDNFQKTRGRFGV